MNENLLGIMMVAILVIGIIFFVFIYNAIIELADGTISASYKKRHYIKAIGFGTCGVYLGYILYQLINILILNL